MIPKLGNGMASLNIPPLDPFLLEHTSFKHKRGTVLDVSADVRKIRAFGGTRGVVKDVQ